MTQPALTVPALLKRSARESGTHTYLVTPTERLTYSDADQRSAEVARRLLHLGVGKGTRVGLFFPNGVDWAIWWLALSRIGAVVVPLSTLYTPAEIAKVTRLADIGLLIAPDEVLHIDVAERFEAALPGLAAHQDDHLAMPEAPYLRRILLAGSPDRPWATRWDADGAAVPPEVLTAVEDEVFPADLDLAGCHRGDHRL